MVSEGTNEVNLIFSQHCIDKELSTIAAYLLAWKEPQEIAANIIVGLKKFSTQQLSESIMAVRKETTVEARMQHKHPNMFKPKKTTNTSRSAPLFG